MYVCTQSNEKVIITIRSFRHALENRAYIRVLTRHKGGAIFLLKLMEPTAVQDARQHLQGGGGGSIRCTPWYE